MPLSGEESCHIDDLRRQTDEIQALIAIFGDSVFQESDTRLSIILDAEESVQFTVDLPTDYPSCSPPQFELSGPSLPKQKKLQITDRLQEIYLENLGEPVLFLWIDSIKDSLSTLESHLVNDEPSSTRTHSGTAPDLRQKQTCFNNSSVAGAGNYSCDAPEPKEAQAKQTDSEVLSACDEKELETVANADNFEDQIEEEVEAIPEIHSGPPLNDRKSTFQAHLAAVKSKKQADLVLKTLRSNNKIARATHNIVAYRIFEERKSNFENNVTRIVKLQDSDDDGETGAGPKLIHLLEILDAKNVMVVVTRWYGGIHLGPDRFKHINNLARQILVEYGYGNKKDSTSNATLNSKHATKKSTGKKHKR